MAFTGGSLEGSPARSGRSLIERVVTSVVVMAMAPKTAPVALQACCMFKPATLEDPGQDGGEGCPEDIAEDAENHADGGQAGALVIIAGQLGGESVVGDGGHGVEGIDQPEAEQDGKESRHTGQTPLAGRT